MSKHCFASVMIVRVPEDFEPQRPWTLPPNFSDGELYAKNLTHTCAQGFANTFNKRQLEDGIPDRRWAIAIISSRKAGNGLLRQVWEQHDKTILEMKAVAWWDSLSEDERRQAKAATGCPNAGIAKAYRIALREMVAARDEGDELPSNDAA
jgi:hypothetical protein